AVAAQAVAHQGGEARARTLATATGKGQARLAASRVEGVARMLAQATADQEGLSLDRPAYGRSAGRTGADALEWSGHTRSALDYRQFKERNGYSHSVIRPDSSRTQNREGQRATWRQVRLDLPWL